MLTYKSPARVILSLILFIALGFAKSQATPFLPAVKYYSAKENGAGHQNWSLSQDSTGIMYFGNNDGLLSYDGYRWNLYRLPGNNIGRSVLCVGKRIYVGTFEEFGYFEPDENGKLTYHSLSNNIKGTKMEDEEVWKILKVGNDIYFQSFRAYYKYDGKVVTGHRQHPYNPLYMYEFEGNLYLQVINDGLYKIEDEKFISLIPAEALGSSVVYIGSTAIPHEMLLVTENNGLFTYSPYTGLKQLHTVIDSELKKYNVNRAVVTPDAVLVLGTTINGVYAIDKMGNLLWHFNRDMRLNNNTVLGLLCDSANNIWVCLDDGISYIQNNSPITIYSPPLSDPKFGMVYDVYGQDDNIYMATNQGLYKYRAANGQSDIIPHTEAQNWFVTAFDNQIFCGNNYHSMEVVNDAVIPRKETAGSTSIKKCIINNQDLLVESSYTQLHIYRKNAQGKWIFSNNVEGLISPIKNLEIGENGIIWADHMYKGMYKIALNNDFTAISHYEFIHQIDKELEWSDISILKVNGRIVFSENNKLYTYDDIEQKIVPYDKLNESLSGISGIHTAKPINNNLFWIAGDKEYALVRHNAGNYSIETKIPYSIFPDPCLQSEANIFVKDNRYSYFNLNNSLACYDLSRNLMPIKKSTLNISMVQAFSSKENILLPLKGGEDIKSSFRDIIIELTYPHYDNSPIRFVYTLQGGGVNLKNENNDAFIRYSSLSPGSYHFKAEAYDVSNNLLGEVKYDFAISVPLYLSIGAFVVYALLLIGIVYLIVQRNTKRALKAKQSEYEQQRTQHLIKLQEQERLIAEQNKQLLESELTLKGKEMATMAIGAIAKNSSLEAIKNDIQQQVLKGTYSRKFLDSLITKINDNIEKKEFWDVFQSNFDLIHENFFRNLRERYPDLTPNDLKFCAYIRLNMSTKDIAQMTNLTIRGVEAARYRLRKKLGITDNENIVHFLIEFK